MEIEQINKNATGYFYSKIIDNQGKKYKINNYQNNINFKYYYE